MTTVLLVEDDINLREIYAARLEAEGYKVVVASDGEEALAKSVREHPSLILLDIMMPKISGFDVLDIIRSTPETKNVKVVMLTALSQPSDKARGEKLGVNKYLVKSQITLEDVVDTVKNLVNDMPQAPQETGKDPTEDEQIEAAVASLANDSLPKISKAKPSIVQKDEKKEEPKETSED